MALVILTVTAALEMEAHKVMMMTDDKQNMVLMVMTDSLVGCEAIE